MGIPKRGRRKVVVSTQPMTVFKSRYGGTCSKCGKPIVKGAYISLNRDRKAVHPGCLRPTT